MYSWHIENTTKQTYIQYAGIQVAGCSTYTRDIMFSLHTYFIATENQQVKITKNVLKHMLKEAVSDAERNNYDPN